jgi:hypothetical protein
MFIRIPDPTFFHPGSEFPGSLFRIPDPDPDVLPIPDPGVKKAPDPGSATLRKPGTLDGLSGQLLQHGAVCGSRTRDCWCGPPSPSWPPSSGDRQVTSRDKGFTTPYDF